MNARNGPSTPPPSDDAPAFGEGQARAALERQIVVLGRLAEAGLKIAEGLGEQAGGQGEAVTPLADLALAFDRVSRSVRLTFLLQAKVIADLQRADKSAAFDAKRAAETAARQAGDAHRAADHARKASIQLIVNRIAEADHPNDRDKVERLVDEACLQLRDRDRFGDVLKRPISEIIGLICRDLGLSPDWPRLADESWARQEIASGKVGPPLAALIASPVEDAPPQPRLNSAHPPDRRVVHAASS